jgi:hypothetical protein
MNRILLVLYFLFGLVISSWSDAQDSSGHYGQYESYRNLSIELYIAGFQNYSTRLRTTAILMACNKPGMADSVDVGGDESAKYLASEEERLSSADIKYAIPMSNLTGLQNVYLISSVNDQMIAYKQGYKDAIQTFISGLPGICEIGMKNADKILKGQNK